MAEIDDLTTLATEVAVEAGETTLRYFRTAVDVDLKADESPVTVADREAETVVRRRLERAVPTHSVVGEEFGSVEGTSAYRWWIDPIDGTKAFVRGVPLYGVLIGLEREGEIVVGVANFPALGEIYVAAKDRGCRAMGRPCHVSTVSDPRRALVSTTDPAHWDRLGRGAAWTRVGRSFGATAGWGDAYGYALVASGRIEAMIDPALAPWDAGPMPILLSEAGGWFGDFAGVTTLHGGNGLATNAALKDAVLSALDDGPMHGEVR